MRWADMDLLGHVNNVTYVDYLQEARIDMLAAHAPVPGTDALAEGVVIVRHDVTFVAPLVFQYELNAHVAKVKGYKPNLLGKPKFEDVWLEG